MQGFKTTFWPADGSGPAPLDTRDLEMAQFEAVARAQQQLSTIISAGWAYNGVLIAIDDASRTNVGGKTLQAVLSLQAGTGVTWPGNMVWLPQGNGAPLSLPTAQDMIAFGNALATYYTDIVLYEATLEAQIAELTTNGACDAFDVTQGWPGN